MSTGNILRRIENQFIGASTQEIVQIANNAMTAFLQAAQLTDPKTAFMAMVMIARIGLEAEDCLTQQQMDFAKENLSTFYTGPMDTIYPMLTGDIANEEYQLLENFCKLGQEQIGIPLLYYILSFAYCDGSPSPALEKKLEEIFGTVLLIGFMRNGAEAVPSPGIMLTGVAKSSDIEPTAKETHFEPELTPAEKFAQDMADWEKSAEPILQQREQKRKETIEAERAKKLSALESARNNIIQNAQNRKDMLLRQKTCAEEKLPTLGFFMFSEKAQNRQIIESAAAGIARCDMEIQSAAEEFNKEYSRLDEELKKKATELEATLRRQLPLPRKPRKPIRRDNYSGIVNEAMKEAILETIGKYGKLSVLELMKRCSALTGLTPQRVRPLLQALVNDGELLESTQAIDDHTIHHYYEFAY